MTLAAIFANVLLLARTSTSRNIHSWSAARENSRAAINRTNSRSGSFPAAGFALKDEQLVDHIGKQHRNHPGDGIAGQVGNAEPGAGDQVGNDIDYRGESAEKHIANGFPVENLGELLQAKEEQGQTEGRDSGAEKVICPVGKGRLTSGEKKL